MAWSTRVTPVSTPYRHDGVLELAQVRTVMAGHRLRHQAKADRAALGMEAEAIPESLRGVPDEGEVGRAKRRERVEQLREHWSRECRPGILVVADEVGPVLREDRARSERVGDLGVPQMAEQLRDRPLRGVRPPAEQGLG